MRLSVGMVLAMIWISSPNVYAHENELQIKAYIQKNCTVAKNEPVEYGPGLFAGKVSLICPEAKNITTWTFPYRKFETNFVELWWLPNASAPIVMMPE